MKFHSRVREVKRKMVKLREVGNMNGGTTEVFQEYKANSLIGKLIHNKWQPGWYFEKTRIPLLSRAVLP